MNTTTTMTTCKRCRVPYMQAKSTSALVLTYCGILCEIADLGFSLDTFEKLELPKARLATIRTSVPVVWGRGACYGFAS